MSAASATGPIPPSSPMFDAAADPAVSYDRFGASKALTKAGWTHKDDGWYLPKATKPLTLEVVSPTEGTNPGLFAATEAVVRDWTALGFKVTHTPLPPGQFVAERLATGTFQVAVVDVTVGLDPDLYPLLASSQTLTGGSNVMGVQDPALDALLAKARAPGPDAARIKAYSDLQKQLAKGRYLLPLAFADEVVVVHDTLEGPVLRQALGPLGSILGCANMAPRRRPVAVNSGSVPRWRNGRRAGFRYQWPQGRVGSSPSLGTIPSDQRTVTPAQVAELVYAYV